MGMNLPLLMTASVSTRGMKGVRYTDEEREQMYVDALTYYIVHLLNKDLQQKIVFAENSGWPMERIKKKLPKYDPNRLEFMSFSPESFDISRGKGYNELLLINMAIEQSSFIKEYGAFFKVTGRYPIFNLSYFIRQASLAITNGIDMYCDMKEHCIFEMLHLDWCGHSIDARLFGVTVVYYQEEIGLHYGELDDYNGHLLEDLLYKQMKTECQKGVCRYKGIIGNGRIHARFPKEPKFGGLEGSCLEAVSFSDDQNSLKNKIKRLIGNGFRLFMPWIWI